MTPGCPDCVAASLRAKAAGHRSWRDGFACYEHAAVDLNEYMAANPNWLAGEETAQPDLFGEIA